MPPAGTTEWTLPSEPGSQAAASPVTGSSAARLDLALPPMLLKLPPTKIASSVAARARILTAPEPLTLGCHSVARPVTTSNAARLTRLALGKSLNAPPISKEASPPIAIVEDATPGSHAPRAPLSMSIEAEPARGCPLTFENEPPMNNVDEFAAIAPTKPFASGPQPVAIPVAESMAAMPRRVPPPTTLKSPPAKTSPFRGSSTATLPSAPGFHGCPMPVVASIAARRLRGRDAMFRKLPPTNTVLPLIATAPTGPSGAGFQPVARPDIASTAANPARA